MIYFLKHFFIKLFTSKIDVNYSDNINLFKLSILFFKRSKGMFLAFFLIPLIVSILGVMIDARYNFWFFSILITCFCLALYLTSIIAFELNNTSFYKKIIIHTGAKKIQTLIPGILVFLLVNFNFWLQIVYQTILSYINYNSGLGVYYLGLYYGVLIASVFSILIGLILANLIKKRISIYIMSIFLPFIILIISNLYLYSISHVYDSISYLNPYRYALYIIGESWNARNVTFSFNLKKSTPFDINDPWLIYFIKAGSIKPSFENIVISAIPRNLTAGFSASDVFNLVSDKTKREFFDIVLNIAKTDPEILNRLSIIVFANHTTKLVNLIMPYLFIIIFLLFLLRLNPLKHAKYG